MCLIAFAWMPDRERRLVLAANRDEFHERPTRPLAWWPDLPNCLAGRDLKAGGTWLAAGRDGRWAAVTNFRDPGGASGTLSRGRLPVDFLAGDESPREYATRVHLQAKAFGPFNLLVGDAETLWYVGSRARPRAVEPGVHALSNGLLDEGWPKSQRVSTALGGLLQGTAKIDPDRLFDLMNDREPAPDSALPNTGVGLEAERILSPPFIVTPGYGTCSTTVLSLGGRSLIAERRFGADGLPRGELRFGFG